MRYGRLAVAVTVFGAAAVFASTGRWPWRRLPATAPAAAAHTPRSGPRPPRRSIPCGAARPSRTSSLATASKTSISTGLEPALELDPRRLRSGLVVSFRQQEPETLPNRVTIRTSPAQRVVFHRDTSGWQAVVEPIAWTAEAVRIEGGIDNSLYEALDAQVARRTARWRRPPAAGVGPRRRVRLAGGLHPRHPARRPLSGGVRAAGLGGRRGPVRARAGQRPHDVRQEPDRLPIRERRPDRLLRCRRQLAPPSVPAGAGAVPPHLLHLRPRALPSGARHHPPPRGDRLRRCARARRSWPRATASCSAPGEPAGTAT